jgi:hypothetical protein
MLTRKLMASAARRRQAHLLAAVARAMGHESWRTTQQSYAKSEAVAAGRQKRMLAVLDGGRLAS